MNRSVIIILVHQVIFQGMFFAKNISLARRLGMPIRGRNRQASGAIAYFALFIIVSLVLAACEAPLGTIPLLGRTVVVTVALCLAVANLCVGLASLVGLHDSWRVGVLEDQHTQLIEGGIYRFTRNPYFLSYLIMLIAYTILLQNVILLLLSFIGFALIHAMVLKEERYLAGLHGERYRRYQERVPRYLII